MVEQNETAPEEEQEQKSLEEAESETSAKETAKSQDASSSKLARVSAAAQRDVPISTVVRMMGLPTSGELSVLEKKVDALTTKVTSLALKVDRLLTAIQLSSDFERIDVQISDVKNMLKELMPKVVGGSQGSLKVGADKGKNAEEGK